MGRASNTDVVAVVPPLIFTVECKSTAQLASVTVRSNTVMFIQQQDRRRTTATTTAAQRAAASFGGLAEDKGEHDKGTLYFTLHAAGCATVHCSLHPLRPHPALPISRWCGGTCAPARPRHTLRTAGWTALPSDHVSAFANEFAMPGTFTDSEPQQRPLLVCVDRLLVSRDSLVAPRVDLL
jgi:hypothetical protein